LLDHIEAKTCVLNQVEYVVLDEADRMLDIGFLPDLQRILSYLPKQRTTLLFSATFSPEIKRLAASYLQEPVLIEVARANATASTVEQVFVGVTEDDKRRAIHHLLRERGVKQAFIFVNSKLGCARLARALQRDGLNTAALHGDKSQDERLKALEAFKSGQVDLLVCTDVAARGLDIKDVPAVFNVDLPFNAEDYVHRIGRTGRAGASGLAISLVTPSDTKLLAEIEKLIKVKVNVEPLPLDPPDARPVGRYNDGRRHWGRDDERDDESRGFQKGRSARFAPARAPYDPLFDKPYEPKASDALASWDTTEQANSSSAAARVGALNTKPKRHLAALFKPPVPVPVEVTPPPLAAPIPAPAPAIVPVSPAWDDMTHKL
jgi:superfamily II DNA/RNA helicase